MKFIIKWWQLIFYETALISLGIILGVLWSDFFSNYLYLLLFLFTVCGAYILYAFVNQIKV